MPVAYLVILVISILSSIANMIMAALNKPKVPQLLPSNIDNVPVAEAGKSIPVVLGRRYVRQPNVVWWGHVKAVPITVSMGGKSGS
jgi:hypothetical protein